MKLKTSVFLFKKLITQSLSMNNSDMLSMMGLCSSLEHTFHKLHPAGIDNLCQLIEVELEFSLQNSSCGCCAKENSVPTAQHLLLYFM